jgi:hypothetical protein
MNALKFTEIQQRELVRVSLHCCNLEKTYNPYYTLILNGLCEGSYSHRFTLQYALWDLFRDMNSGAPNVAKAMAYMVPRGVMDLSVFKVGNDWGRFRQSPSMVYHPVDIRSGHDLRFALIQFRENADHLLRQQTSRHSRNPS